MGQQIEIAVDDGSTMSAYCTRPDGPTADTVGVIVAHELFGVSPDIRAVADEIAAAGHVVIAPEFYHRDAEPGRYLARDDAGRDEGFALLHSMTRAGAVADVRAAIAVLAERYGAEEAAAVGFSAGGHLAYLAATALPITRVAIAYGGWLPSTEIPLSRPDPTLALTPGIRGELIFLVGGDDFLIDSDQVEKIADALRAADVRHEVVTYPGVGHAFFWPGTPAFDQDARDDAMKRILALLAAS
ncbi:dienelactone hydrolase family protein [Frankia sp. AgKG'84/4]|uniref:dienelactone hydrolase family protein n=1 Tax=Frankia sp. AgKG'84/4 TaxID=573490 RepID=UPI00200BFABC|nr:dienelactone hydrolase family protein [Frankia sp. AgKG'84/4]MCL9792736.1 dienelactone hydrolase family protein [Frankia sp. AgKG'84/4]